jgi:hypothetical protein
LEHFYRALQNLSSPAEKNSPVFFNMRVLDLDFYGQLTLFKKLTLFQTPIAQSFSPNSAKDGQQTCRPARTELVLAGRQVCRPSRAKLGLKDWANNDAIAVGKNRNRAQRHLASERRTLSIRVCLFTRHQRAKGFFSIYVKKIVIIRRLNVNHI